MACGGVAQLVEHLVCNQAVVGSSPFASTTLELRALDAGLGGPRRTSLLSATPDAE
jgi:hypothetical protein